MAKFKILMLNAGYFTHLNGSIENNILRSHRYLFNFDKTEEKFIKAFNEMVLKENPDLIFLMEVRKNQFKSIINKKYPFYDFDIKYTPKKVFRKMPRFDVQGNGFMAKEKLKFRKFFLKKGIKTLCYEIVLPNKTRLILFHFSLRPRTRIIQLKEIDDISKNYGAKIICGDFNTFKGISELEDFIKYSDLNLIQKEDTFPSFKPSKPLDLFVCSRNLKAKTRVLKDIKISDHLPVVLELDL